MRKVSETVITAFLAGKSKKVGNTYSNGNCLYLHGNQIASNTHGIIRIYDGGFASATTKERLNALLQLINSSGEYETVINGVYQKNFQWFFNYTNGDKGGAFKNGTIVGVNDKIKRMQFNNIREMKNWLSDNNDDRPKFINWILFQISVGE